MNRSQRQSNTTPAAVELCHDILKWMIPQLNKFPRQQRFTLGERIETGLLEVLESLVEAAYSKRSATPLSRANLRLQRVKRARLDQFPCSRLTDSTDALHTGVWAAPGD